MAGVLCASRMLVRSLELQHHFRGGPVARMRLYDKLHGSITALDLFLGPDITLSDRLRAASSTTRRHESGQVAWEEFARLFELVNDSTGGGGIAALNPDVKEVRQLDIVHTTVN